MSDAQSANPVKKDEGMADPHAYIFNDTVYLFTTRDVDPKSPKFNMHNWDIHSSTDMVNWTHRRTIYSADTYMGESANCWATETVERNGKYYFYFSNGNNDIGVMVADRPDGPYVDVLKRPMIASSLTGGKEYDPTVVEHNGDYYMAFGAYRGDNSPLRYRIAKLNEDMISLAETPQIIEIQGELNVLTNSDKPNIHKYNGLFYLSGGSNYATSKSVYGPYERLGDTGNDEYGLNKRAHGNFFTKDNQWFHTWCHFHNGKENGRYRESYISYLHYRKNGEMVTDTKLMEEHFDNGVGSYSADWDEIEAEWFMASSHNQVKQEFGKDGFAVAGQDGAFVKYPYMRDISDKRSIIFNLTSRGEGIIEIRRDALDGEIIGKCRVKDTDGEIEALSCRIDKQDDDQIDLFVVFKGKSIDCKIDNFKFN